MRFLSLTIALLGLTSCRTPTLSSSKLQDANPVFEKPIAIGFKIENKEKIVLENPNPKKEGSPAVFTENLPGKICEQITISTNSYVNNDFEIPAMKTHHVWGVSTPKGKNPSNSFKLHFTNKPITRENDHSKFEVADNANVHMDIVVNDGAFDAKFKLGSALRSDVEEFATKLSKKTYLERQTLERIKMALEACESDYFTFSR